MNELKTEWLKPSMRLFIFIPTPQCFKAYQYAWNEIGQKLNLVLVLSVVFCVTIKVYSSSVLIRTALHLKVSSPLAFQNFPSHSAWNFSSFNYRKERLSYLSLVLCRLTHCYDFLLYVLFRFSFIIVYCQCLKNHSSIYSGLVHRFHGFLVLMFCDSVCSASLYHGSLLHTTSSLTNLAFLLLSQRNFGQTSGNRTE